MNSDELRDAPALEQLLRAVRTKLWAKAAVAQLVRGAYLSAGLLFVAGIVHAELTPLSWWLVFLALAPVALAGAYAALWGRPPRLDAATCADRRLELRGLLRAALEQLGKPVALRAGAAGVVIEQAQLAVPSARARLGTWRARHWTLADAVPAGFAVVGLTLLWGPGAALGPGAAKDSAADSSVPAPRAAARPVFGELQALLEPLRARADRRPESVPKTHPAGAGNPPLAFSLAEARAPGANELAPAAVQRTRAGLENVGGEQAGQDRAPLRTSAAPGAAVLRGRLRAFEIERAPGEGAGYERGRLASEPVTQFPRVRPPRTLAPARATQGAGRSPLSPQIALYAGAYLAARNTP